MKPDPRKNPAEGEPIPGGASDSGATMKAAPTGSDFDPRRIGIEDLRDPAKAEEALTHWDELDPALLTAIASHPQHGPRLAILRRADRWLETKGPTMQMAGRVAGPCPSSEELYDFGRGPGFLPMESARRGEIERHLRTCRDCENLVETLAAMPPVPIATGLEVGAREAVGRSDGAGKAAEKAGRFALAGGADGRAQTDGRAPTEGREGWRAGANGNGSDGIEPGEIDSGEIESGWRVSAPPARRRLRALPRLVPLAAAASLVVGLGLWIALSSTGTEAVRFPTSPLLRGSSGGPLFFPRDRVLHVTQEVRAAFPALDGKLLFEVEAQSGATNYKIDVAKHGGDVFAADEGSVLKLSEAIPSGSASGNADRSSAAGASAGASGGAPVAIRASAELEPGPYTWSARATVHGLDQELGRRDFSVVEDAEIVGRLLALGSQAEPKRSMAAVMLLHEAGFLGEARAIARAMPASPERDAYLSQLPGR